ncbi:hypothetical protein K402DRAFT_295694, partial [Aulographum hederae CBS 113979]
VECLICFEQFPPTDMIKCSSSSDPHEACRNCVGRHIGSLLADSNGQTECMTGECKGTYTSNDLRSILKPADFEKLEKLQQGKELRDAKIPLERCPHCEYQLDMSEVPTTVNSIFQCMNDLCMQESCRICRKDVHRGKKCSEAAADKGITVRHMLETAMSEALIRKCFHCQLPYMKEHGCNHITCSQCHSHQCYICRAQVFQPYQSHF